MSDPKEIKIITPKDFSYTPNLFQHAEFEIDVDAGQWAQLCKLAHDRQVKVGLLLGCIIERALLNLNYLDPSASNGQVSRVSVKLKDIRNATPDVFAFGTNEILSGPVAEDSDDDEDLDGGVL